MGDRQVLVETLLSAVSPGTESLIYRGEFPGNISKDENIASLPGSFSYPMKYGYSAVGRVIDKGKDVDPQWKDRLVMAFNPHESHFLAEPEMLMPFPEDITGGWRIPAQYGDHGQFFNGWQTHFGEDVAVFGQGIVGLLTTALLSRIPLSSLVALDNFPMRRRASQEAGASVCLDPGDEYIQEKLAEYLPNGADLTYEVSGSPAALDQALAATGFAGRIIIGSWYGSRSSALNLGGRDPPQQDPSR